MSVYEITTEDGAVYQITTEDAPPTRQQQPNQTGLAEAAGALGQGALFGFGDEIAAGGNAALDWAKDKAGFGSGRSYDEWLNIARGSQKQFADEHPVMDFGLQAAGSLAAPASLAGALLGKIPGVAKAGELAAKLPILGKALTSNAAKTIGENSLAGALYGYGSAESDDRLGDATKGAALGGVLSGALLGSGKLAQGVGSKMNKWASASEQSALGITAADRAKAIKQAGQRYVFQQSGVHPFDNAIETAKQFGITKGSLAPDELLGKTVDKTEFVATEIRNILGQAQEFRNEIANETGEKFLPLNFNHAKDFIENEVSGKEQGKLLATLEEEVGSLKGQIGDDLLKLQKAKENIGRKSYAADTNDTTKRFYRQLTRDLKESIENEVDRIGKQGGLPADAVKTLKDANKDYGELLSLQDIFTNAAAKEGAADPVKGIKGVIRTSGGWGNIAAVATVATALSGNMAAAPLAWAAGSYAESPRAKMHLANALSSASSPINRGGKSIEDISSPLTRALLAARF